MDRREFLQSATLVAAAGTAMLAGKSFTSERWLVDSTGRINKTPL